MAIESKFRSCTKCYYKVNRPICQSLMGDAATCPEFRPAKLSRKERLKGGKRP